MDPYVMFDLMMGEVKEGNWDAAKEHAANLRDWVMQGGYIPDRPYFGDWLVTVLVH